jgi:hypothetical protein
MRKSLIAAFAAFFISGAPVSAAPVQNEIIFLMDMSGSMLAPGTHPQGQYAYWQQEIDFVQSFIDQTWRADGSNAYGIAHFSGGSSSQSLSFVAGQGRMNLVYGLQDPDTDPYTGNAMAGAQDKASLDAFVGGMGPADFEGGFSWMDEAFGLAYQTFQNSSNGNVNRYIFLLTDGNSATSGHEVAIADPVTGVTTYESATLQALRSEGVEIATVLVNAQLGVEDVIGPIVSAPELIFDVNAFNDFSTFLPGSATAMVAPPAAWFMVIGLAGLAFRRRAGSV